MLRYTLRRLALVIPILFALSIIAFLYAYALPGDPVTAMLGTTGNQAARESLRRELGLDRPILEQYLSWLANALQGNLGLTFRGGQPIGPYILSRIPATLELALAALFVGLVIALPSGIVAGMRKNSRLDYFFSVFSLLGYSIPLFWTGYLLLLVFAVNLRVLPTQGYVPFLEDPIRNLTFLVLPALSLGLLIAPFMARMVRTAVIETLQEPFIGYARAKGLRNRIIFVRYILRNALVSVLVVLGLNLGYLLGGQIIIEEMFNWPGAGRVIIGGVRERDYFVIQAAILVYATLFIFINLVVELVHGWLDPRVQLK